MSTKRPTLTVQVGELRATIEAQNKVLADQRRKVATLEADVKKLREMFFGSKPAPGNENLPPSPPPATPSPPPASPSPKPAPPAAPPPGLPPAARSRMEVRDIVLSEFAKRTTFIPGGGDIEDPNKAIGLWTTLALEQLNGATAPEATLRAALGKLIQRDVNDHPQWPRVPQSVVTLSGTGVMPK